MTRSRCVYCVWCVLCALPSYCVRCWRPFCGSNRNASSSVCCVLTQSLYCCDILYLCSFLLLASFCSWNGNIQDCNTKQCKRNGYTCNRGDTCTFGDEEWYVRHYTVSTYDGLLLLLFLLVRCCVERENEA